MIASLSSAFSMISSPAEVPKEVGMTDTAYVALACFWKPDAQFGCQRGILRTRVGYCGGTGPAPNYPMVRDHTEAVEVVFDPAVLSYEELLQLFWRFHDPCSCKKRQYMSALFPIDQRQREAAEGSKKRFEADSGKSVSTQILPLNVFHEAEGYHQKYFLRTYHKSFYNSLPKEDPVTSTRDARLNGYLCGHGTLKDVEGDGALKTLNKEQMLYVKNHVSGKSSPANVVPLLDTAAQISWNFCKTALGFKA